MIRPPTAAARGIRVNAESLRTSTLACTFGGGARSGLVFAAAEAFYPYCLCPGSRLWFCTNPRKCMGCRRREAPVETAPREVYCFGRAALAAAGLPMIVTWRMGPPGAGRPQ